MKIIEVTTVNEVESKSSEQSEFDFDDDDDIFTPEDLTKIRVL